MVGIYKILSPSGKVYIGQSRDIKTRWRSYLNGNCKAHPYLYRSIMKYGIENHLIQVIHYLPSDTNQLIMNIYECLYMDLYKSCGIVLLNIKEGGSNGKHAKETIEKAKATKVERGIVMSNEVIEKGKPFRFKKGHTSWNKGTPTMRSDKTLKQMSLKKATPKMAMLIKEARERAFLASGKYEFTDDVKKRMSQIAKQRYLNNTHPMKGYKFSAEQIIKMNKDKIGKPSWNKGIKSSKEWKAKLSAAKKGRTGSLCPNSKKIYCSLTNIIYDSIGEAAKSIGINRTTLNSYLTGQSKNKTTLEYKL